MPVLIIPPSAILIAFLIIGVIYFAKFIAIILIGIILIVFFIMESGLLCHKEYSLYLLNINWSKLIQNSLGIFILVPLPLV